MKNLWECFIQRDVVHLEINPLIYTPQNRFYAAHSFMMIDDHAKFRQQNLATLQDFTQMSWIERAARQSDIKLIRMDGKIGVLSNGAGTMMSTSDYLATIGGQPSAVVDIGGGNSGTQIQYAVQLLMEDPQTKALLFNCYWGDVQNLNRITRVIRISDGLGLIRKPIILRYKGINDEMAYENIREYKAESGN